MFTLALDLFDKGWNLGTFQWPLEGYHRFLHFDAFSPIGIVWIVDIELFNLVLRFQLGVVEV